jgi:hypothetical protein
LARFARTFALIGAAFMETTVAPRRSLPRRDRSHRQIMRRSRGFVLNRSSQWFALLNRVRQSNQRGSNHTPWNLSDNRPWWWTAPANNRRQRFARLPAKRIVGGWTLTQTGANLFSGPIITPECGLTGCRMAIVVSMSGAILFFIMKAFITMAGHRAM